MRVLFLCICLANIVSVQSQPVLHLLITCTVSKLLLSLVALVESQLLLDGGWARELDF